MMLKGVTIHTYGRSWLGTYLLVAALFLTSVFAWLHLILSSHHACSSQNRNNGRAFSSSFMESFPSPFPWQPPDFSDSDPFPTFHSSILSVSPYKPFNDSYLSIRNIVFCIAGSADLWPHRKEFIKLWWRPRRMRGFVWLDEPVNEAEADQLPLPMVSEDTSSFRYTHPVGNPAGIRIARILLETFRLGIPNVHWFVIADDDTLISADNLLRILSKYNANEMYYIGAHSESHLENYIFSYSMAYGGGGIAISYPLAEALVGMFDDCIQRYLHFFGSDDRLHACISELGVPITKEPGFHQMDIRGSAFGLMAAHPVAPFVSLHHLELIDPIFPHLGRLDGLRLLVKVMQTEPSSFLQQSICYQSKPKLSISVSLGYAVQIYPKIMSPRELQKAERTFRAWNELDFEAEFDINTRPSPSICDQPYRFYLDDIHVEERTALVVSTYKRDTAIDDMKKKAFCWIHTFAQVQVQQIRVVNKPLNWHWYLIPRRQCCTLVGVKDELMDIAVDSCMQDMAMTI